MWTHNQKHKHLTVALEEWGGASTIPHSCFSPQVLWQDVDIVFQSRKIQDQDAYESITRAKAKFQRVRHYSVPSIPYDSLSTTRNDLSAELGIIPEHHQMWPPSWNKNCKQCRQCYEEDRAVPENQCVTTEYQTALSYNHWCKELKYAKFVEVPESTAMDS